MPHDFPPEELPTNPGHEPPDENPPDLLGTVLERLNQAVQLLGGVSRDLGIVIATQRQHGTAIANHGTTLADHAERLAELEAARLTDPRTWNGGPG